MSSESGWSESGRGGTGSGAYLPTHGQADSLADVLERVLDKGIVIVGDIQVRLLDIELLTIKLRLMVASVERAREMGINWWESDEFVTAADLEVGNGDRRLGQLAKRLEALESRMSGGPITEPDASTKKPRRSEGRRS